MAYATGTICENYVDEEKIKTKTKYYYLLFFFISRFSAAKRRRHRFASGANINERRHGVLLFSGEFHKDFKVNMFRSDSLRQRLELIRGEVEEILLSHPSRSRGGCSGDGGSRDRSGGGCGCRC